MSRRLLSAGLSALCLCLCLPPSLSHTHTHSPHLHQISPPFQISLHFSAEFLPKGVKFSPFPVDSASRLFMHDKDKRLPSFLSERLHTRSHLKLVTLTRTHTDRYFCDVSSVDSPLGRLNKQTYLACGEGTARACLGRLAAPLLLAEMHHANLHSWLAQMWFLNWSEPTQRCGFADFS